MCHFRWKARHALLNFNLLQITGLTKAQGGQLRYPESVVFTKKAILPVEVIVLRFPNRKTLFFAALIPNIAKC